MAHLYRTGAGRKKQRQKQCLYDMTRPHAIIFVRIYSSSTRNTATWRMPLAPMTKVCSMSVLRLGPVMMVICEGLFLEYLRFTVWNAVRIPGTI